MLRLIFARASRPAAALALALASAVCLRANAATPVPAPTGSKADSRAAANPPATVNAAERAAAEHASVPPAALAAPDFFSLAERYGPAVVHVIARSADDPSAPPEQEAIDTDDPFFAFFKRAPQPSADGQSSAPRAMTGAGSGFIVDPNGLALTTAHVVDNAEEVTVRLTDKREFKAQVVAVDPQSDVAVLQIENARNLPFVKLGDSSTVRAGEPVLSIGSPDSFQNTVTTGIVSAASRTLPGGNAFPFLQTDVAINPDNSGGPLFDRAGEVIGIDVQLYADNGPYDGLTFAIPIEAAKQFRAQLQAARNASAPATAADPGSAGNAGSARTTETFGMQVEDVSPGMAAALGLPHPGGALVDAVEPGSPAAAAGVSPGDVILQVGDKPIDRAATLAEQLAAVPPATRTSLAVIRNHQPAQAAFTNTAAEAQSTQPTQATQKTHATKPIRVAQAAQPSTPVNTTAVAAVAAAPTAANAANTNDVKAMKTAMTKASPQPAVAAATDHVADRLGLITHALTEEEKQATGLPLGLMVENSIGPAAKAGVRPGDVVLTLDETLVETQDQAAALEAKATNSMEVLIQRNHARSFVAVKLR